MTEVQTERWTRVSRTIRARAQALYDAFIDPDALVAWLPPDRMTGTMHRFEHGVGGGYCMSLYYPADAAHPAGKTAPHEDRVTVRFVELIPPARIVQTATFHTTHPDLMGEMTMVISFDAGADGTEVGLLCRNLPPGIRQEDNEVGSRQSLEQLARRFEA